MPGAQLLSLLLAAGGTARPATPSQEPTVEVGEGFGIFTLEISSYCLA